MLAVRAGLLDPGDRRTRLIERADGRRAVIGSGERGEAIDAQFQRLEEIAGCETQAQILVLPQRASSPVASLTAISLIG